MTYEGIDYAIRAGLGRNEWVLLISFPDNVGGNPSVVNFSGSRNTKSGLRQRAKAGSLPMRVCREYFRWVLPLKAQA